MASLDPYPLIPHTLLDAVNICLRAIGSSAVLALDTDSLTADSEMALKTVHDTSIQVQQQGWQWNTEKALSIDPWPDDGSAAAGVIILPLNVLKVEYTFRDSTGQQLVQRGNKLYDPWSSTYKIGETVTCRLIVALDFEELPQAVRQYITAKASRVFAAARKNNLITNQEVSAEESQALVSLLEAEDQNDDLTWEEKNIYLARQHRHRRRIA